MEEETISGPIVGKSGGLSDNLQYITDSVHELGEML